MQRVRYCTPGAGRFERPETGGIPWSCLIGNVSARSKGLNRRIATLPFLITWKRLEVGEVGWLQ